MELVKGFEHVAVVTGDLDALASFYVDVFGARVHRLDTPPPPQAPFTRHAMIEIAPGVALHPFECPDADLDAWGTLMFGRGRIDHFAIHAADRDAFEEVRARLVQRGASDGTLTDFGAILSVGFTDPDGMRCELCLVVEGASLADAREPDDFVPARMAAGTRGRS